MERLKNELQNIGLNDKEARIYLACLELGPTNIQNIASKADIKRSTVYEILESLKGKGLMHTTTKGKRKQYLAAEPENLLATIKEKEKALKEILPQLKSINNVGFAKPKITFYEGKEGLREIYMEALKSSTNNADWISPMKSVLETVGTEWMEHYVELKVKKNYWIRSIHVSDLVIDSYKYQDSTTFKKTLRDVRFSPKDMNIPNAIGIYDNKVAILSSRKEGFGFIIESDDYAQSMKELYKLLWDKSLTPEQLNSQDKNLENQKPQAATEEDIYY
ncbi:MAG: transcriptional regulator, TrmB [uncultured bacterium]|nr:MAG: transcriptional regulator, TrmB [uncultured bacterium]